jgi:hypothetical protein
MPGEIRGVAFRLVYAELLDNKSLPGVIDFQ